MRVHNLIGILLLNKRDFLGAITEFKILRDIADEAEESEDIEGSKGGKNNDDSNKKGRTKNDNMRLHAYNMLGCCYQFMREYENAIKCFKKQLELAWSKGNIQAEM
jgi:tetratricopeptide (TPR) repeat protein